MAASQPSALAVPLTAGPSSSPVMSRLIEPRRQFALAREEAARRGDEGCHGALHVGRASAVELAMGDSRAEGILAPSVARARRHHVGMAGEAEIGTALAEARIEIVHLRRVGRLEGQTMANEAQPLELALEQGQRAALVGRDARAADEGARELDDVDEAVGEARAHARSSSLIEVLARVRSSTRLTMTQQ